ncbi:hypothetical protein IKF15_00290 [Candidatus Saccharibacteria bacterium]|nr:hypothetical protein [Candidatus Saccharibacteria bacterium]
MNNNAQSEKFEELIKARFAVLISALVKATNGKIKQFDHLSNVEHFIIGEIALAKGEKVLQVFNKE